MRAAISWTLLTEAYQPVSIFMKSMSLREPESTLSSR